MQLTPEQIQVGGENFNRVSNGLNASSVNRRDFLKAGAAGWGPLISATKSSRGTGSGSVSSGPGTRGIFCSRSILRNT